MIAYLPKFFTNRAILIYVTLLLVVSLAFGYPMAWYWWLFGLAEVCGFFYFGNLLTRGWQHYSGKALEHKLFTSSMWIRLVYVVFAYVFYKSMTGVPFEFGAADAHWYDDMGRLGADIIWGADIKWAVFFEGADISDLGYPMYLAIVYAMLGKSILLTRCVKAVISAWTVVLIYRLARRNFGEDTGRMAAVFCMLMPNLIFYCGLHLKETEMLFLTVAFIELADKILHSKKANAQDVFLMLVSGIATFFFRGVLCAVLFLALAATFIFGNARIKKGGKWVLEGILVLLLGGAVVLNVTSETLGAGEYGTVQAQQDVNMQWRAERAGGNAFAAKAGAAVFAPLIFTIPFPTIVNIETQKDQQMINGGNYVKNITSFFTILAMLLLLLSGKWRDHLLPIAFTLGYLVVLVFSSYAQSERFHIPSLPFELMFAAYGINTFSGKKKNWFIIWLGFIFVANIGWAWFKLRGRGM